MEKIKEKKKPSLAYSILILAVLALVIGVGITVYKIEMIFMLLFSWLLLAPFVCTWAIRRMKLRSRHIRCCRKVLVIMLTVGALIAVWLCAGTVPALIYYGLKLITPQFFLLVVLFICSFAALATGSSWATVGTVGIAMMGIGAGLGIPAPVTAGAVISGTYFGDKMSPVSDSVLLNSTIAGCKVMEHVRHSPDAP